MSNLSQFLTGVVMVVDYANRATLRSLTPAPGAVRVVTGLGLFAWSVGAAELDDDATCFATATGRWVLIAADPDYVFGSWVAGVDDLDYRVASLEGGTPETLAARATALEGRATAVEGRATTLEGKYLFGSFNMSLTTLATIVSSNFTVTVTGAVVGDSVIVNPGNSFGTAAADQGKLSFIAYVSAADTVTVSIRNASASTASMTASTWAVLVIKH